MVWSLTRIAQMMPHKIDARESAKMMGWAYELIMIVDTSTYVDALGYILMITFKFNNAMKNLNISILMAVA